MRSLPNRQPRCAKQALFCPRWQRPFPTDVRGRRTAAPTRCISWPFAEFTGEARCLRAAQSLPYSGHHVVTGGETRKPFVNFRHTDAIAPFQRLTDWVASQSVR
jgi:hypothetical protein